jgi:hypothetical protein
MINANVGHVPGIDFVPAAHQTNRLGSHNVKNYLW